MIRNGDQSWTALIGFENDTIVTSNCDIKRHSLYHVCNIAKDCSICSAMESCGNKTEYYLMILIYYKEFFGCI